MRFSPKTVIVGDGENTRWVCKLYRKKNGKEYGIWEQLLDSWHGDIVSGVTDVGGKYRKEKRLEDEGEVITRLYDRLSL